MKKQMKKIFAVVMALTMVFAMSASAFATDDVITPSPVNYPLTAHVMIYAEGETVTDVNGTVHHTNAAYAEDDVVFNSAGTVFTQYLPAGTDTSGHQLNGYPTILDAICKLYVESNGSNDGLVMGWDSNPYEGPQGAYITTLFDNSTITTVSGLYRWEGYSWTIYLNDTTDTWDAETRTGKIPYYASNIQIQEDDQIYVLYEKNVETW